MESKNASDMPGPDVDEIKDKSKGRRTRTWTRAKTRKRTMTLTMMMSSEREPEQGSDTPRSDVTRIHYSHYLLFTQHETLRKSLLYIQKIANMTQDSRL